MQVQPKTQETWVKILSKGIITIPKNFRDELGLEEGDVAKARVEGKRLIIESRKATEYKEYRTFSKEQIDDWEKEDQLPEPLASKTKKFWSDLP
jgi:AbrB family looped-hinge helix DNA binding protein